MIAKMIMKMTRRPTPIRLADTALSFQDHRHV